jgi:uncharacterized protein YaaN involved in tellurite resistance
MSEIQSLSTEIKVDRDGNVDLSKYDENQIANYKKYADTIVKSDPNSIISYGADINKSMSNFSDTFLAQTRTDKTGEFGELINNLLTDLNYIDVDKLEQSEFKKFLSKFPIIRNFIMSIEKICQNYDTISVNVNKIANKIQGTKITAMKDNAALETMFNKNVELIDENNKLLIAGYIKLKELNTELESMLQHPEDYQEYEISDFQEFVNRLDKRLINMRETRFILLQSLAQIRLVQNNNVSISEKSDSLINTTIPVWKNQLAIAISLNSQKNSIEIQNKTIETTQRILTKNAELLKRNSIDVAKASEAPIISIDVLRKTQQDLIETIMEVKRIHEEGKTNRIELTTQLENLESDLKKTLTENN